MTGADGKLQEQLNAIQKEITRLEYQNNELEQVRAHTMRSSDNHVTLPARNM